MNYKTIFPPKAIFPLAALLVLALVSPLYAQGKSTLNIHVIDVGYGDAILVKFASGKVLMIDAGGEPYAKQVLDYLQSNDVQHIDWAVITHPHENHFGGYVHLLRSLPVGQVFINGDQRAEEGYAELLALIESREIPVSTLKKGMNIQTGSDAESVSVLHPNSLDGSVNGNALVMLIAYGDFSFLATADIEPQEQKLLAANLAEWDAANYVQIPHHAWPVDELFRMAIQGKILIASTGENEWGVPHEGFFRRFKGGIYRTDRHGTIVISSDGQITTEKDN